MIGNIALLCCVKSYSGTAFDRTRSKLGIKCTPHLIIFIIVMKCLNIASNILLQLIKIYCSGDNLKKIMISIGIKITIVKLPIVNKIRFMFSFVPLRTPSGQRTYLPSFLKKIVREKNLN